VTKTNFLWSKTNWIAAVMLAASSVYATADVTLTSPNRDDPIDIGLVQTKDAKSYDPIVEWRWALRGGGVEVRPVDLSRPPTGDLSLIIVDDMPLGPDDTEALSDWVADGGLLLLTGSRTLLSTANAEKAVIVANERVARLAGIKIDYLDAGLIGSYPLIAKSDPLLGPFLQGDALRLGSLGVAHHYRLRATDAEVLAQSAHIRPGPGELIFRKTAPTITVRRNASESVLFVSFSLASVAACYPDKSGQVTDCSAAGTAHALMRAIVANMLWEEKKLQIALPWGTPGDSATGVLITGDVHADSNNLQIRSARQMAKMTRSFDVPLTFFVVGDVATQARHHYDALAEHPHVEIASHSAHGKQYRLGQSAISGRRRGGIHGADAVRKDVNKAEVLLGIPVWPHERAWKSSIRTEAWNSNQTESQAWTGMEEAGIALVFDHNADSILSRPAQTAPTKWFETSVRERIFIPTFEKNIVTGMDQFRLSSEMARRIASLASPQPDPCCNDAVSFQTYGEYVMQWHKLFRRVGVPGGVTEVWLWHPSIVAMKAGFPIIEGILQAMSDDTGVAFFRGSELGTWYANREKVRVRPSYATDGSLTSLALEIPDRDALLPLPPKSSVAAGTVSYWVFGEVELPGWKSRFWKDAVGRPVTVFSRDLQNSEVHQ